MAAVSRTRKFELYSVRVNLLARPRSSRVTTFEEQQQTPLFSAGNGKQGPRGRFGSLKGQSTDGRWQAPDRVPFSRGSFPETRLPLSHTLSLALDNIFEKNL